MTQTQINSLKKVIDFYITDEEKHFSGWMSDNGWGDDEIDTFERLSNEEKLIFIESSNLTNHIYYHLLNLKSIE